MKNGFKKYLIGLSVFGLLFGMSCSKRESSGSASPGSSSYNDAQAKLASIGLGISIPTMDDFASTDTTKTAALTSVFSGNDSKTTGFDTSKFTGLESAISDLQSSLTSYTGAPKMAPSMSPNLADASFKNSDLAYVHFILGYYYTLHAVLKLRVFVGNIIQVVGTRYALNWDATTLNSVGDSGRQAVLDAYFMLNGVRYMIDNNAGNGKIYANKDLPAGSTKCASYHFDKAIEYAGNVFPQLQTALTKLKSDSFKAFFDEIAAKMATLGVTQQANN